MWFPTITMPPLPANVNSGSRVSVQSNVSGDATVETHVVTSVNGVTTTVDRNEPGTLNVIATSGGTTIEDLPSTDAGSPSHAVPPPPPPNRAGNSAGAYRQRLNEFILSVMQNIRLQLYRLFHITQHS